MYKQHALHLMRSTKVQNYKSTKQAISGNCKTNHTNHTSNFSESLHAHTLYSVQTQHSVHHYASQIPDAFDYH